MKTIQNNLSRFLRPTLGVVSALCIVLPLTLLSGCGGGGSSTSTEATRAKGTVSFAVKWPEPSGTRLIPAATRSLVVTVVGARATQTQIVERPNQPQPVTNLPLGSYTVTVVAFDGAGGNGTRLATGTTTVNITLSDTNPTVRLSLAARLTSLVLSTSTVSIGGTPPTIQLNTSGNPSTPANLSQADITLTGFDVDGAVIPLSSPTVTIADPTIATLVLDPTTGTYKLTTVGVGTTTITATDPETGISTTLVVRVVQTVVTPFVTPVWTQILNVPFRAAATLDTTVATTPEGSIVESRLLLTAGGRLLGFTTSGTDGGGFPITENYNQILGDGTEQLSQPILGLSKNPANDIRYAFVTSNAGNLYIVDTRNTASAKPAGLNANLFPLPVDGAFTEVAGDQESRVSATVAVAVRPDTTNINSYFMEVYVPTTAGALGRVRVNVIPSGAGVTRPDVNVSTVAYYQTPGGGTLTTPALDFGPDAIDLYTRRPYKVARAVYVASSNLTGQSSRLHGFRTTETVNLPDGGEPLFTTTLDGGIASGVAVGRNYVFVATGLTISGLAQITAIEKETGAVVWRRELPNSTLVSGAPVLSADGDTVYIGTWGGGNGSGVPGGQVFAVDANTSVIRWNFVAPYISGFAFSDIDSTLAVGPDGRIYAGSTNSRLYALNPADGSQSFEGDLLGEIRVSPTVSPDGTVYIGSDAGSFSALR